MLVDTILSVLQSPNAPDSNMEPSNVVDALDHIAIQLKYLGGGQNSDTRGAVEVLAISVKGAGTLISDAIDGLAAAIREGHEA